MRSHLTAGVSFHHCLVSRMTGVPVGFLFGVFCLVVLEDAMLLLFFDVLPVSFHETLSMAAQSSTMSWVGVAELGMCTVELIACLMAAKTLCHSLSLCLGLCFHKQPQPSSSCLPQLDESFQSCMLLD